MHHIYKHNIVIIIINVVYNIYMILLKKKQNTDDI